MKQEEFKTRFKAFRKHYGPSQEDLSEKLGFGRKEGQAKISHWEIGRNQPDSENLLLIAKTFPNLNIEWLLTGKGEMLKEVSTSLSINEEQSIYTKKKPKKGDKDENKPHVITLYEVGFPAGHSLVGFADTDAQPDTSQIMLPEFKDCDFAAKVYGDSMSGRYEHGDICFGKVLPKDFTNHIRYGEPYYIITKEGKNFAYVRKATDKTKVILRKHNEYYDDVELSIDDITQMIHIKGKGKFERLTY